MDVPASSSRLPVAVAFLLGACVSGDPAGPAESPVVRANLPTPVASTVAPYEAPAGAVGRGSGVSRDVRIPGLVVEDETSLRAAVEALRVISGLPLVVDARAERRAEGMGAVFDLHLPRPIAALDALALLLGQAGDELGWVERHGVLLVTTRERARGATVLVAHDVRTLTMGVADFRAPRIGLLAPGTDGDEEQGVERVGGLDEAELEDLIREHVAPGTWDEEGISISGGDGILFVRHVPAVQGEVRRLLGVLGRR